MIFRRLAFGVSALLCVASAQAEEAADVALVTAVQGSVTRAVPSRGQQAVPAFVKVKNGDRLTLAGGRIQLVYFDGGRQETWQGDGRLDIGTTASQGAGLPAPQARTLPAVMVKQIAKTPTLDSQGRAGAVRLRGVAAPAAAEKLMAAYRQLRNWAQPNDISPELFVLAGLSEQRDAQGIEQVLADLRSAHPNDAQVEQIVAYYRQVVETLR